MFKKLFFAVFTAFLLHSCAPLEDYYYLSQAADEQFVVSAADSSALSAPIQPGDQLSIVVSSSSPELTLLFNSSNSGGAVMGGVQGLTSENIVLGYLVDAEGNIAFPQLGNFLVSGVSLSAAQYKLEQALKPLLKNVVVNVRKVNFRISVMGEVARPGLYVVPYDRCNLFQGLAMAGDLTVFGKRGNVLLVREENGVRKTIRLNLNDKELLSSSNYYLKSGDIIYVEPNRTRVNQSSTFFQVWPTVTSAITLLILVLNNLQN
jgi:polysaccharide export outer membrane protein